MKTFLTTKNLLIVSVALNVLFVAMFAGAAMRGPGRPERAPDEFGMFIRVLPRDVVKDMAHSHEEMRGHMVKKPMNVDELATAIEAEPMDIEGFVSILRSGREARDANAAATEEMFAEKLGALPVDERQAIAAKMRYADKRRGHDRRRPRE